MALRMATISRSSMNKIRKKTFIVLVSFSRRLRCDDMRRAFISYERMEIV